MSTLNSVYWATSLEEIEEIQEKWRSLYGKQPSTSRNPEGVKEYNDWVNRVAVILAALERIDYADAIRLVKACAHRVNIPDPEHANYDIYMTLEFPWQGGGPIGTPTRQRPRKGLRYQWRSIAS